MNIVMPVAPTVKTRQPDFVVATPAELGASDARHGQPCRPDFHYAQGNDYDQVCAKYQRADYVFAYITAKGL